MPMPAADAAASATFAASNPVTAIMKDRSATFISFGTIMHATFMTPQPIDPGEIIILIDSI